MHVCMSTRILKPSSLPRQTGGLSLRTMQHVLNSSTSYRTIYILRTERTAQHASFLSAGISPHHFGSSPCSLV